MHVCRQGTHKTNVYYLLHNYSFFLFHSYREKVQASKRLETFPTKQGILEILQKEHGFTFWLCNILKTIYELMTIGLYIAIE